MLKMYSSFLLLFCGFHLLFAKSIQNQTVIEGVQKRLDKIEALLENLELSVRNINSTFTQEKMKADPVAFFAIVNSRDSKLATDSAVVFDTVIINVGDHYDKYDGIFVAPRDGIYMFSWTVSAAGADYFMSELVVEDKVISSTGEQNTHSGITYISASTTAMCRMKQGDHAWIRTTGYGSNNRIYSKGHLPRTSFHGLFIHS